MSLEPDGIERLLEVDDPVERRLALKSKAVEPYHLRMALQDEDPEVRRAAAHHPRLTPELMREILSGNDRWLAGMVMSRVDLTPELLEHALQHPDLHIEAVRHPAFTEEQRSRIQGDPDAPETLQNELHKSELSKNIGYITFPNLDSDSLRNPGAHYPRNYEQYRTAMRPDAPLRPQERGSTLSNQWSHATEMDPTRRQISLLVRPTSELVEPDLDIGPTRARTFTGSHDQSGKIDQNTRFVLNAKRMAADEAHEVQHGVFARLGQKYGAQGRKVIAEELIRQLPEDHAKHLQAVFKPFAGRYHPSKWAEETISFCHNYLQDPQHRHRAHIMLRIANQPDVQHEYMQKTKAAWREMRRIAVGFNPEALGLKKHEDRIEDWVARLQKSRQTSTDSLQDHLGHHYLHDKILSAVEFLTGKNVDSQMFRAKLLETEDPVEAALLAAGLTEKDRPAFEGVVATMSEVSKAEASETPKQVSPMTTSAQRMADDVQWAVDHGSIESVKLGGKHSRGSMMARDQDGTLYLLKPGSGKPSPARGISEEAASESRREAAFYATANEIGIEDVPETELLSVDGKEVASIKMLGVDWSGMHRAREKDQGMPRRVLRPLLDNGTLFRWAVADYVFGNTDRHGNNIMVGPDNGVALIDHGSAFAGASFDPAHDNNSFVPYYLRVWGPDKGWSKMSPEDRLKTLPVMSAQTDLELRDWILSLNEEAIIKILYRYGIDPAPSIDRLKALKVAVSGAKSASETVDRFWVL